jgi:PKD repeat protein
MKKTLLCAALGAVALLGGSRTVLAQAPMHKCATDEHNAALEATYHNPELAKQRRAAEALSERLQMDDTFARQFRAQHRTATASRIVPLVVHVVTKCGNEALTKARIEAGLLQLNQDWSRTNADAVNTRPQFLPYAENLDVEFRLAKLDPNGNPTDGIHRISDPATDAIDPRDQIKTVVPYWDGYFNVWLVDAINSGGSPGTILGYAQFPGTGPWSTWGLVMRFDDWTAQPISNGRTAAHEMGHCFNLRHSFTDGGGCGTTCANSGDMVCDTPPSASSSEPCSPRNTCSNDVGVGSPYTSNVPDQDENFMSYNNCQNMFSMGQKARVDAAIVSFPYITTLVSQANLIRTGVNDGQVTPPSLPVAYASTCQLGQVSGDLVTCAGRPVSFGDASYGSSITGVTWTFSNGTPATSTDPNPVVVFNTPGRQTVTLVATDANGTSSAPLTLTVNVLPAGSQVAPLAESFEGSVLADSIYRVGSSNTNNSRRWRQIGPPVVTTDGDTAVFIANGNVPANTANSLYSPTFDTRNLGTTNPQPTLTFDIAYSRRNTSSADELRVYLSVDCGRTWVVRKTLVGAALSTTGTQLIPAFVPTSLAQWRTESVTLTGQFVNQQSVMVRFESTAQASGNNLYLDNLRIAGRVLGLTADFTAAGLSLAPNPLTNETALTFSLTQPTRVQVRVTDILGRTVLTEAEQTMSPGNHQLPLAERLRRTAAGVYIVTAVLDGQPYTQKLVVQ